MKNASNAEKKSYDFKEINELLGCRLNFTVTGFKSSWCCTQDGAVKS